MCWRLAVGLLEQDIVILAKPDLYELRLPPAFSVRYVIAAKIQASISVMKRPPFMSTITAGGYDRSTQPQILGSSCHLPYYRNHLR